MSHLNLFVSENSPPLVIQPVVKTLSTVSSRIRDFGFPSGITSPLINYVEITAPVNPYFNASAGTYTIPVSGNYTISLFVNYQNVVASEEGQEVNSYINLNNTEIVAASWTSPPDSTNDNAFNFSKFTSITQYFTVGSVISTGLNNGTPNPLTATYIFTIVPL